MKNSNNNLSGGVATSTGMDYQSRVAAWFATRILAEKDASVPWGLPSDVTFESIRLETEYPLDDILVTASNSGRIFIQVKHTLYLEKNDDSNLASVLNQIVRQFLISRINTSSSKSSNFQLDRDRMLIIVGPTSPTSVSTITRALLDHVREQPQGLKIPQSEQQSLSVLTGHIERSWKSLLGTKPGEDEILQLLSSVYIFPLDVDRDGRDELTSKDLLRQSILKKSDEADTAWNTLLSKIAELTRSRGGLDRGGLQKTLLNASIDLRVTNSYREDVERLKEYSQFSLAFVSSLSKILVGSREIKVDRVYPSEIQSVASISHLLVVGEPGAGKSGVLHDLVDVLTEQEQDVVFLASDRLSSSNLSEEIGLSNQLFKILLNWPGISPGFLVIDALDAARNDHTAQQIRNLIEQIIRNAPRWHVVASVRKFDLRHNTDLRGLFRGEPVVDSSLRDDEFVTLRHINIRDFSEDELVQVRSQSSELSLLLNYENPSLNELLRKPFNLRLVGELIGDGISLDDLTPIRTQIELLAKYWSYRVIRTDGLGDAREHVLKRVVDEMLKERAMMVDRSSVITDVHVGQILSDLLSSHMLKEWQRSPASKADRYILTFSHNMLFDYATSRLVFGGNNKKLVQKLEQDPELVLAVRPSIVYHFQELWFIDPQHERFWDAVSELLEGTVPLIGKLIGPSVAVELTQESNDYGFVYAKLESSKPENKQLAYKIIQDTIGALLTILPERSVSDTRTLHLWSEYTERISRSMDMSLAYSVSAILTKLCEEPKHLSREDKGNLGCSARRVLELAWSQKDRYHKELVARALVGVCRTYDSDPVASRKLIEQSLESDHLQSYGFDEMPRLADEVDWLIVYDPGLSEEIYRKVF